MRLKGMNCVVTGGGSGIGAATVKRFVSEGAEVLIADIAIEDASVFANEMGEAVAAIKCDVRVESDVKAVSELAYEHWDRVDVLVNNLGDAIRRTLVPLPGTSGGEPISDDEWRAVLDINLTEAFKGCRAVGSHFLERRQGKVINISAFAARKPPGDPR